MTINYDAIIEALSDAALVEEIACLFSIESAMTESEEEEFFESIHEGPYDAVSLYEILKEADSETASYYHIVEVTDAEARKRKKTLEINKKKLPGSMQNKSDDSPQRARLKTALRNAHMKPDKTGRLSQRKKSGEVDTTIQNLATKSLSFSSGEAKRRSRLSKGQIKTKTKSTKSLVAKAMK